MKTSTKGLWLAGAVALGFALSPAAFSAPDQHDHGGEVRGGGDRGGPRGGPPGGPQQHFDARFQHNHYYPARGYAVGQAPHGGFYVNRGRDHYWYAGGVWYRPYGPRWVVVGPPFGAFVPVLPPLYTTVWWGGIPYYYANDTYYVWRGDSQGYEVVAPPDDRQVSTSEPQSDADDVFVYPKSGQSDEQTNKDRYECHRWASDQTGFDPTQPGGGTPAPGQPSGDRKEYFRAMTACLEGRGYSVR